MPPAAPSGALIGDAADRHLMAVNEGAPSGILPGLLRAGLVSHGVAVAARSLAAGQYASGTNRLDRADKDRDQPAQQIQRIGAGQQPDQRALHGAQGMGHVDLLGLTVVAAAIDNERR